MAEKRRANEELTNTNSDSDPNNNNKKLKTLDSDDQTSASSSTTKVLLLKKGAAPVDTYCEIASKVHVLEDNGDIYDAMLNQTDIGYSLKGHNKFIVLQVLQDDKSQNKCYFWQRWGRVGVKGQTKLTGPFSAATAIQTFCDKFQEKTMNRFEDRDLFKSVKGKYDLVKIDYNSTQDDEAEKEKTKQRQDELQRQEKIESKLYESVQLLMKLIFNVKAMEEQMLEMNYDAKKAPLGKLTKEQIKVGYECLKAIEDLITANKRGQPLIDACNEYYTKVPHAFGMKKPPLIDSSKGVKAEMELLQALGDIEIAMKALKSETEIDMNPLDQHYKSLNCDITPLNKKSEEFQIIHSYMKNTHGPTHRAYTLEIEEAFSVRREVEHANFTKEIKNKKLLWHGSRTTNFVGILTQGLRIAPPEAPVTGYMFGKGVYFADMSSKSANYAHASKSNPTGLLILCEVALGEINELVAANYHADKLPSGKQSVKGLGKTEPDPTDTTTLFDDVVVPWGKSIKTGVVNPKGYTLEYNEFIVYDLSQVRIRYILRCKYNFV